MTWCSKKSSPTAVYWRWDCRTTIRRKARTKDKCRIQLLRKLSPWNVFSYFVEIGNWQLWEKGSDHSRRHRYDICTHTNDFATASMSKIVNGSQHWMAGGTRHGCPHIVACLFWSAELRVHLRPEQPSCCSCHLQLLVRTRRIMNLADKKKKMFRLAPPRRLNASFVW